MDTTQRLIAALHQRDLHVVGHVVTNALLSILPVIQGGDETEIEAMAKRLSEMLRLFPNGAATGESQKWVDHELTRYAGHLEAALALGRSVLTTIVPQATVAMLRRKYMAELLVALVQRDQAVTELAREVGLSDPSQAKRCVEDLAEAGLVSTVKSARERWVTLTAAGRRLATKLAERGQPADPGKPTDSEKIVAALEAIKSQLAELKVTKEQRERPAVTGGTRPGDEPTLFHIVQGYSRDRRAARS